VDRLDRDAEDAGEGAASREQSVPELHLLGARSRGGHRGLRGGVGRGRGDPAWSGGAVSRCSGAARLRLLECVPRWTGRGITRTTQTCALPAAAQRRRDAERPTGTARLALTTLHRSATA